MNNVESQTYQPLSSVWEGDVEGQRRMVTVDHLGGRMSETFGPELTRSMIRQSGMSRKNFYSYRK
ncbi:MAG: hypothetical protein KKF43_17805 [Proteobacteria bacterium]|nr:hypothetical protein [Pseudomonadota bacterium]